MVATAPRIVVLTDRFPELSETFVVNEAGALAALGRDVSVECVARPVEAGRATWSVRPWVEESTAERMRALFRLVSRHPLRCARDLLERRRWRREEAVVPLRMLAPAALRLLGSGPVHLHVHFAGGAGLAAMRLGRILSVPWSLTAHAWDIYQRPANLEEKLRRATFVTSGAEYTAAHLRGIAGPDVPVHVVVMGVDGEAFRRSRPYPGGRTVLAVGRLVEKKGFTDLIAAAALLRDRGEAVDLVIAGEGPLRSVLCDQVSRSGLGDRVRLVGAVGHDRVRELLEEADVVCMPCVVAADGDRDSMPVVVKEALAMEVPVVATDEVALPEVVRPEWGRLVPPRDPPALAAAIADVLRLPEDQRIAMGAVGRAHVLEHADVRREAAKLAGLVDLSWERTGVAPQRRWAWCTTWRTP